MRTVPAFASCSDATPETSPMGESRRPTVARITAGEPDGPVVALHVPTRCPDRA
jgi:hypothetical protein